jgi:signal transduction histidine kinase
MSAAVFTPSHPARLWVYLLPAPLAAAALAAAAAAGSWLPPAGLAALITAAVILAAGEGLLLARDLPRAREREARARHLEAVYEVISKAGGAGSLQEVLDAITRLTVDVSGVRGCSIKLLDPADGVMHVRSLAGIRREVSGLRKEAAESIYARSLLDGRPVLVDGAQEVDFPELDGEVESLVCVPLRRAGRPEQAGDNPGGAAAAAGRRTGSVAGALCLYSEKGRKLSPETLSFLSRLGDLVSIAIENASVSENLRRVDEARTWFLMKASHELKSPLSAIQSVCQTLLGGYLGELEHRQRENIQRVSSRAVGLLETAKDLLLLAQERSAQPGAGTESVELCVILDETVRFFQPAAQEKGINIAVDSPCEGCRMSAPRDGVRSIMTNLLSNAIKYSPSGSTVSVSLRAEAEGQVLTITDRGIGIPAAEREKLFSDFFRASNARTHTTAGTGLGMAIVKSVVQRMGGSISVDSEEGRGTRVRVLLGRCGSP